MLPLETHGIILWLSLADVKGCKIARQKLRDSDFLLRSSISGFSSRLPYEFKTADSFQRFSATVTIFGFGRLAIAILSAKFQ
jgi:hypothetical protein